MNATFIELVVDGEIVDLNRISLPARYPDCRRAVQGRHNQMMHPLPSVRNLKSTLLAATG